MGWGKETPPYRVAAGGGETCATAGTGAAARPKPYGSPYGTSYEEQKLTYVLTVPTAVSARDRKRTGAEGAHT
ncbi:hypothetical protein GCM10018773_51270 [Streptomyces candidus]|nr:hypothetical protein GCM10018773_51270 [Streptomyces candidus]